jgi:bacillaene synthase trans-acting acyltransferase
MFSGQGSQYFHMGRVLYDENPTFRKWMDQLDDVARQVLGTSVIETLYSKGQGKGCPFDRTLLTHPAIFMVEYSLAQLLIRAGIWPDIVLGASLGSFAAAAVGGFIVVEDALHAVIQQAMSFEENCEPGGMIAVLADPGLFAEEFLCSRSELATVNFSSHFVVSAKKREIVEIEAVLKNKNLSYQRLPVSFPFHSRWIQDAKGPFAACMRSFPLQQGRLPLACCDCTGLLFDLPGDFFWSAVRHPIRFRETVARLEQQCARRYIDVGPAGTLATFLKYGMPGNTESTVHTLLTPYGAERKNLSDLLTALGR